MGKLRHEFRDPIHNFIYVNNDERKVIDSKFFQRLRYIHQLALTYLVYPGASHKRFEHSLGVMELASRVFDVVFDKLHYKTGSKIVSSEFFMYDKGIDYYRSVLRLAALCHDIGHLPFSHAAEADVLPAGKDHETIGYEIITKHMKEIWDSFELQVNPMVIGKVAVGVEKVNKGKIGTESIKFNEWERMMSEIIVGDAFGADRIDYLLRDSYHIGVAYGKFDHYRLIDCMRLCNIVPNDLIDDARVDIGIDKGGLNSAEALMLARYFMFNQVYFHKHRRISDYHLKTFFKAWIDETMPKDADKISFLMELTDNEVLHGIKEFAKKTDNGLALLGERILNRNHFRKAYSFSKSDISGKMNLGNDVVGALKSEFNEKDIYYDTTCKSPGDCSFPVIDDDKVVNSMEISDVLPHIPIINLDTIYADKKIVKDVKRWIENNIKSFIKGEKHDEQ